MQTVYEFKLPVLNNPSYQSILLLSKVVIELEGVETINAKVIEQFFTADLAFLEDMYEKINVEEDNKIKVICPNCGHEHEVSIGFK